MKTKITVIMAVFFVMMICGTVSAANTQTSSSVQLDKVQVPFVENQNQTNSDVDYYANTNYGTAYVTNDSITHAVKVNDTKGVALKEQFLNKNGSAVSFDPKGENKSKTKVSYFTGNSKYTNLPTYNQVSLGEIYQGITVKLRAYGGNVEKLFYLQPGANIKDILMKVLGANSLHVLADGRLAINTDAGTIYMSAPQAYQNGKNITMSYILLGNDTYGFKAGKYDHNQSLTIDPYVVYSTYLGGSSSDGGNAVAVDSQGNVYVTGSAGSADFPHNTTGVYQTTYSGGDVFVSKYSPNGTLLFSTYFGGSGSDGGVGIVVYQGNIYITGNTRSTDFPHNATAYQTTLKGLQNIFITELSSDGSQLLYSTYLGGSSTLSTGLSLEGVSGIAVYQGNIYVTGQTSSTDFPHTTGAYQTTFQGGNGDAFVSEIAPNGNGANDLVYSTYLGGSGDEDGYAIAVYKGIIDVAGKTTSSPYGTNNYAFVSAITPNGNGASDLKYTSYLGSSDIQQHTYAYGMAVDANGNIYITGQSGGGILLKNPYQSSSNGGNAFVAKYSPDGTLAYSTYLGTNTGQGRNIAVDNQGDMYITGYAYTDFPTTTGALFQGNMWCAFLSKLSPDGSTLLYSTYLGGSGGDSYGYGIAVDDQQNVYLTGQTKSSSFPVTDQTTYSGGYGPKNSGDAFVAKFATAAPTVNANVTTGLFNTSQTVNLTTPDSTATIYYTTDGSDPTTNGIAYNGPITINSTTTLRYAAQYSTLVSGSTSVSWGSVYAQTYTIDTKAPTVSASLPNGTYNTTKVTLTATDNLDRNPVIYYSVNNGTTWKYQANTVTLNLNVGKNVVIFYAVDKAGNNCLTKTLTYNIDTKAPIAKVSVNSGLYNVNKIVTLSMSEPGTIYYTLNGSTPTTSSKKYTGAITISSTATLKFVAVDKAGNKSPVYAVKYTIDKTAPKVSSTSPKVGASGVSKTGTIAIKFSENVKSSVNWSKVYMKNLTTGKLVSISKWISGNTLYIKMVKTRYAYNWYKIYIPTSAVKDSAGNNLASGYKLTFKTGRY